MRGLTRRLLYAGPRLERYNMLWNIAGSFCYALASMVLSVFVMRMAGEEEGGIFSFGFSTLGQQLFIVAYFGIRPFQITDGKGEYSFGDYLCHRRLTCLAALAGGGAFLGLMLMLGRYDGHKAFVLFLLVCYKVIDGFADVYESEFQRQGSLYLTGKSNFFRTILSVCACLGLLGLTGDLTAACLGAVCAQTAGVFLFNLDVIRALPDVAWQRRRGAVPGLFRSTAFLFASVFLDFYIFSSAKYAIDRYMSDADSGYFNLIFMPTSVIYMVANFIIRPFLTRLTALWDGKRISDFKRELLKLSLMVGGLTVLAAGAAFILGKWILTVVELILGAGYGGSLNRYWMDFALIVLGGGFYALANLMYYALVIARRQRAIFTVYAAGAGIAWLISRPMVESLGIHGAAVCYLLLMAGLTLGFGIWTLTVCGREERKNADYGG